MLGRLPCQAVSYNGRAPALTACCHVCRHAVRATSAVPAVHVGVPPARDHMFVVTASRGKHAAVVVARTD